MPHPDGYGGADAPFRAADGCLQVGGIALDRLALRVGGTPFYAYDRSVMHANVARLRAKLPAGLQLHYSLKANPMPALVQYMAQLVDGFDVASGGELGVALDTGKPPAHISFTGPGKSQRDLSMAVAAGAVIHLESGGEMTRLAHLGEALGITPKVALRVNPDFELKLSGMRMGGGSRPFGVDAEQAPAVLTAMAGLGLEFVGLHIFCGSQNLQAAAIAEAQSRTLELAIRLAEAAPAPLRMLNIGGGFGIPYFRGEAPLDLAPVAGNLHDWMPRLQAQLPDAVLVLELGRYLVGNAGVYVTRVLDRKVSRGKVFLICDGGMHHHLAASGNLGQKIHKNYPLVIGNKMQLAASQAVSIAGPLCTPLDLLANDALLAPAEVGDLVVVFQSGAYGRSASPTAFLSHPLPCEVLV